MGVGIAENIGRRRRRGRAGSRPVIQASGSINPFAMVASERCGHIEEKEPVNDGRLMPLSPRLPLR